MKTHQVPQDNSPTYYGQQRVLYATDESGRYSPVRSSGWDVEASATQMAVDAIREETRRAWERAKSGESSALEYHMWRQRMDIGLLAQAAGVARWRVRRHMRPTVFEGLSDDLLARYASAMGITVDGLRTLPEQPALDPQVKTDQGVSRH